MVVGGRCRTVGCQQHLVARVLTALARLAQCAGYAIDTGTENYICHSFGLFLDLFLLGARDVRPEFISVFSVYAPHIYVRLFPFLSERSGGASILEPGLVLSISCLSLGNPRL